MCELVIKTAMNNGDLQKMSNIENDIVNGMCLDDFIKKYGKQNEYIYYEIINICKQDLI